MVRRPGKVAGIWAVVILALILVAAPFAWIVTVSLKYQIAILMGQFPFEPSWANYASVLFGKSSNFLLNVWNSLIVGAEHRARAGLRDACRVLLGGGCRGCSGRCSSPGR